MMNRNNKAVVLLITFTIAFALGCKKQQSAKNTVLEALNPTSLSVTNGHSAVLKNDSDYYVVVPHSADRKIYYSIFAMTNGTSAALLMTNDKMNSITIKTLSIGQLTVTIGYDGDYQTAVRLGFESEGPNNGIALYESTNLARINIDMLNFKKKTTLHKDDLLKSIGMTVE